MSGLASCGSYALPSVLRRSSLLQGLAVVLAGALGVSSPVSAQSQFKWDTHNDRVDSTKQITALGTDVFGDQIDLQTGTLSFNVTDVDLPGNNGLPVRFTRSYRIDNTRGALTNRMLADWEVEVPRLSGRFSTQWLAGTSTNRCSSASPPAVPASVAAYFQVSDFWQGVRMDVPGVGGGELLVPAATTPKPTDGQTYRWYVDGHVHLYCLPSIANGTGEGFMAVTPDGTKYRFNYLAQRTVPGLSEKIYDAGGTPGGTYQLPIAENTLYATRVEDRFGNYVDYTYTNTATQVGRLTRIASSDGRQIDITYGSNGKIQYVRAGSTSVPNQRSWTYGYGVDNSPEGRTILSSVALPDGTSWQIQFAALSHSPIVYATGDEPGRTCESPAFPQNGYLPSGNPAPTTLNGSITHPAGATASFTLDLQEHSRSNVTVSCSNVTTSPAGAPPGTGNNPNDDNPLFPIAWYDWTLTQKQISGPGLSTMTWTYSYESDGQMVYRSGSSPAYPVCTVGASCYQPYCTSDTCAGTARATITLPDGNKEKFTFGNSWQYNEGKLLKIERQNSAGTTIESVTNTYDLSRANQAYLARYGTSLRGNADGFTSEYHRPTLKTVTNRDGTNFTWEVASDLFLCSSFKCFDTYARPRKVSRSSSLNYFASDLYTYSDHTSKWVIGQLASTTTNGVTVASATYNPSTAQLSTFSAYGQLQQTLTYHTSGTQNGNVASVQDGNSQITYLNNWKRGVPQSISYPGGATESAVANDFGEITSITDELGYSSTFGYDSAGRLNNITHPTADTVSWLPTTITYSKVAAAEYGIPAQHWRRTETTGTRVRETYYDGLWRPILDRKKTTDGSSGERFVRRSFDYRGLETFVAYPVASVSNYTTLNTGTSTTYDVLGRPTDTVASSELGTLSTSTQYLSGFQVRHTNARGFSTTTTYQAFDKPTYDFPMQVQQPEGVTSTYTRDVFGKPLTLARSGSYTPPGGSAQSLSITRRFVYDTYQRLCKTIEPDAGTAVMEYDGAGNLSWRAAGQNSLTSTTDCQRASVPASERSVHRYDGRNRLLFIDHPAGTDDVGYTYFNDGAMQTATTGTLNASVPPAWSTKTTEWTYGYNKRRLLTSESLFTFNRTFALSHVYNTRGDLEQQTYPSGLAVSYLPNAYGEPRQAGGYAYSANYHPNDSLSGFTYGNTATRTVQLNTRQLPSRIRDVRCIAPCTPGSELVLFDHQLTYDNNANLATLIDNQPGAWETRTLGYDTKDRLTTVSSASQGNETYAYDVLDNVRQYVRGSQDRRFNYNATSGRLDSITFPSGTPDVLFGWNDRGELTSKGRQSFPDEPPPGRIFYGNFEQGTGTGTASFTFDKAGRLVSYLNGEANYLYDAHGLRVRTSASYIGTRYHVYSRAGKLVYAQDEGRDQRSDFIYLGDTLVAQRDRSMFSETATTTYLHSDYRGTPSIETNTSGSVLRRNLLKAYGDPYDGQRKEGPGFTNHANDTIVGMVYMQQRYYDPEAMRFISGDSVGADPDNFNRFWYANSNPYTYTDPDGRVGKLIRPVIKIFKHGGDVKKAGRETLMEIADSASTLVDPSASGFDKGVALFDLLSPVSAKELKAGGELVRDAVKKADDVGSPTAFKKVDSKTRERILERDQNPDGSWTCATCGHSTSNPANIHTGHVQARSHGGDLSDGNLRCEGAACNLSQGNRDAPRPGMTCAERGSCGAPYGRTD